MTSLKIGAALWTSFVHQRRTLPSNQVLISAARSGLLRRGVSEAGVGAHPFKYETIKSVTGGICLLLFSHRFLLPEQMVYKQGGQLNSENEWLSHAREKNMTATPL